MTNQDYKNTALAALKGNWAPAVLASVFYILVLLIFQVPAQMPQFASLPMNAMTWVMGGSTLAVLLFVMPLAFGFLNAFRKLLDDGDNAVLGNSFRLGFTRYLHTILTMVFMGLKTFLWTLLFIIPGLVMAFAYAMTPYVMMDHPELSAWEASKVSRQMMKGHKFDLFYLELSFIGWDILSILTLGIGLFWLTPYMMTSMAAFYNDIKKTADN